MILYNCRHRSKNWNNRWRN